MTAFQLIGYRTAATAVVACASLTVGSKSTAQTVRFADDFDAGTSGMHWITFDTGDATANFAHDYSAQGIPPAPRATGGSTVGLRFSVNNASGALHAISAYPAGRHFSGDFRLRFDMWINYNGGPGGGAGSTEFSIAGFNHSANGVHWPNNPASDGYAFAVSGEGGASEDYQAYRGATMFTTAAGVYVAGSQNHFADYYQTMFPSPSYETAGAPGKHWVDVEMRRQGNVASWRLNGVLIATFADSTYNSGNIMLGYWDPHTSIANPPGDNFILYDNISVESLPPPDCNDNQVADDLDIAHGTSLDCNLTGVPDECETITDCDFDSDGAVTLRDFAALARCLTGPDHMPQPVPMACASACLAAFDADQDEDVDLKDLRTFQRRFDASPIPPRPPGAMPGSLFVAEVSSLSLAAREQRVLEEVTRGNIPSFLRGFVEVQVTAQVGGQMRTALFAVMPDYLCIGSNEDFVRMPMTPRVAQPIADAFGCLLPTRKMVDHIYATAPVKLAPSPISPDATDITLVSTFYQHHLTVEGQRAGQPLGRLVGGHKKDVVITPLLAANPDRVAIYGWHRLNGVPIQPLYLGHVEWYVDYSHGIRLVRDVITVDGVQMPLADVLADPVLSLLVSDEGPVPHPRYP